MAYRLDGRRPLIFCANPRTGSTAIAQAMLFMGAKRLGSHHDQPICVPEDAIVFQVVRHHCEVLNSFWWKSKPTGNFENFLDLALSGGYPYIRQPMYWREVTHTIQYNELEDGFNWLCDLVGIDAPEIPRTPSRTKGCMFAPHLKEQVKDVYGEEMRRFGYS